MGHVGLAGVEIQSVIDMNILFMIQNVNIVSLYIYIIYMDPVMTIITISSYDI